MDSVKAIAIILVCLGHILQTTTADYLSTKIYNIIFAVQMPVFFVVSGFFSKKGFDTLSQLQHDCGKKAICYLVPFFSRILLFNFIFDKGGEPVLKHLITVLKTVDSGLWFLWVLFILSINNDIASFLIKNKSKPFYSLLRESLVFFLLLIPWGLELFVFKVNYLGPKLIIYYSIFYYIGKLLKPLIETNKFRWFTELLYPISLILGLVFACKYPIASLDDSFTSILIRLISGIFLSF